MMVLLAQFWAAVLVRPVVSAVLALALAAGLANYPLWQRRLEAMQRHEEVRTRGEVMLAALADRERIGADRALLTEALEVIDRNLVSEDTMEVNLGYFYRLEKNSRVRLARIDQLGAAPGEANPAFRTVPVSLQVYGTYRNLLGFMRELETGPRLMRTRSYRLERTDPNGTELQLFLTVELLSRP